MDRLFPWFLIKGHFKSLSIRSNGEVRQNWPITMLVYGLPVLSMAIFWFMESHLAVPVVLQKPTAVLTAVSLLAGGTLTAFTHISTLRLKLTERAPVIADGHPDGEDDPEADDRAMVDEAAVHLVMAAFASTLTALILIVSLNFASGLPGTDEIGGPFAWIVYALLAFDSLLYWIAIPRVYLTYVELNKVDPRLAGNASGY